MNVILPLTKGHLSNKDGIVWQKGVSLLEEDFCVTLKGKSFCVKDAGHRLVLLRSASVKYSHMCSPGDKSWNLVNFILSDVFKLYIEFIMGNMPVGLFAKLKLCFKVKEEEF